MTRPLALHLRSIALLAVVALYAPFCAYADGYNDWTGGVLEPGEFLTVPAISLGATTLSDGARGLETFPQAQFQIGLLPKVDLILAGATRLNADGALHDWIYIQPRIQLIDGLSFSPGLNLQMDKEGDPLALAPGLFHTVEPGQWQITWNFIAYLTPSDWATSSFFLVGVFERKLNDTWSIYTEVDVFHYFSSPAAEMQVTGFLGAMWNISDLDSVNICLFTPMAPSVDFAATAVGVWWSHGFTINPLRRP